MFDEFKKFALKGNMVDMAVGIIIGAAFGTVVRSLVDDVIMPIISAVFGTPNYGHLFLVLRNPTGETFGSIEAARAAGVVALAYGLFINALIAFLIVAVALFFVVRGMNRLLERRKAKEEAVPPPPPPEPTKEELLLTEIRDLLQARRPE